MYSWTTVQTGHISLQFWLTMKSVLLHLYSKLYKCTSTLPGIFFIDWLMACVNSLFLRTILLIRPLIKKQWSYSSTCCKTGVKFKVQFIAALWNSFVTLHWDSFRNIGGGFIDTLYSLTATLNIDVINLSGF